jgi:hypothetical protein
LLICGFKPKPTGRKLKRSFAAGRMRDDTIWFVAPAKEQLALIAENGLHGISFG